MILTTFEFSEPHYIYIYRINTRAPDGANKDKCSRYTGFKVSTLGHNYNKCTRVDNNGELWCIKYEILGGFADFDGPCDASICPALTEEEEEEIEREKNAPHPETISGIGDWGALDFTQHV